LSVKSPGEVEAALAAEVDVQLPRRDTGEGHEAALRRLAKLLGQLHHCLTHRVHYEQAAWPDPQPAAIHAA